jgi:hypothetical protein
MNLFLSTIYLCLSLFFTSLLHAENTDSIIVTKVSASSVFKHYRAENAVDNKITDDSRWLNFPTQEGAIWLQLEWDEVRTLHSVQVFSGFQKEQESIVSALGIEFREPDGTWRSIPSAMVKGNTNAALKIYFDSKNEIKTNALRITVTKTEGGIARIKEVVILPSEVKVTEPVKEGNYIYI